MRVPDGETVEIKLKVAVNPEFERWLWSWGDAVQMTDVVREFIAWKASKNNPSPPRRI